MESHNHPSFIEPFQGAATGVGGIMRDIFTMGARPIANLNSLRFGSFDYERTRFLLSGVVAGISSYGNCMGVPTVAGECSFHDAYNGNNLVNAMTVGLVKKDKIFYSAASTIGATVVYVGARTGKDGIHGATMSSAEFSGDTEDKRPTVQVGDPLQMEKLLMEACLELMQSNAIFAIQDMGAAGLTCSSIEMVSKGKTGIEIDLDKVPLRDVDMTAYDIMLSESQERMLMVLDNEKLELARDIFDKWGVNFAIIGSITDTNRIVVKYQGKEEVNLLVDDLSDHIPEYDRDYVSMKAVTNNHCADKIDFQRYTPNEVLKKLFASTELASKRWIYEQYDFQVCGNTIAVGGDATIMRIRGNEEDKLLALTSDVNPRYCKANSYLGAQNAVMETWRNITAVGGMPLAITNCLNFANPEKKEIMGQLVDAIDGISDACRELKYPVISGNVSLYNETDGKSIIPTPTIGGVGIVGDNYAYQFLDHKAVGYDLLLIGSSAGCMQASLYMKEIEGIDDFASPPTVDFDLEKKNGDFVRELIDKGIARYCHDLSDGGLYPAIVEMTLRNSIGVLLEIDVSDGMSFNRFLFCEDNARYLIAVDNIYTSLLLTNSYGVQIIKLGNVVDNGQISLNNQVIQIDEIKNIYESVIPAFVDKVKV